MRFKEQSVVVTGAASGIGRGVARRFAHEGARVALVDLAGSQGEAVAAELREAGHEAQFFACDVTSSDAVSGLFDAVAEAHGGVDVLHANAGVLRGSDFPDTSEQEWDFVIETNLKSVFLCGQAAARRMIAQGRGGAIINTASIAVLLTAGAGASYSASKGGVAALTRSMALSLAPRGVRVNAIAPGTVATEMMSRALSDEAFADHVRARTPLGRFADPDKDIAGVVAFLASEDAAYITGQTLYIDAGRLALNYTMAAPRPRPAATAR